MAICSCCIGRDTVLKEKRSTPRKSEINKEHWVRRGRDLYISYHFKFQYRMQGRSNMNTVMRNGPFRKDMRVGQRSKKEIGSSWSLLTCARNRGTRSVKAMPVLSAASSSSKSSSTSSTTSSRFKASGQGMGSQRSGQQDVREVLSRLEEFRGLVQEFADVAVATGPRAITRTAQAAEAFLSVGREQIQRLQGAAQTDPPEVILRQLFERLGSTYIKLGQFIASSPTIFPAEYVEEFQKCLDQAPPVKFEIIRRTVEKDLGMSLEDIFESVETEPLASASIAQVHAAVLRGSKRDVVIKVLKPQVEDTLTTDLNFLYIASRALEFAAPELSRASLSGIVSDIRNSMLQEVDFTKEAEHINHFASFLDSSGLRSVATCPQVYRQFSSRRVLVMDRLYGSPLTDLQAVRQASNANPEQVLVNALNVWIASVLGAETFHADVHAGNILVLSDGKVGFIDFGIVGKISLATWSAVEALLRSVVEEDYGTAARALATIGVTSGDIDFDAFAQDLRVLGDSLKAIDADLVVAAGSGGIEASVVADDTAVNRFLIELVRVGEENGIRFPREFALLLKQILYFDRYTRLLAPTMDVLNDNRVILGNSASGKYQEWDYDITPQDFEAR